MANGELIYRYSSDQFHGVIDDTHLLVVSGSEFSRVQLEQGREYQEMLSTADWQERVDDHNVKIVETQGDGRGQWKWL